MAPNPTCTICNKKVAARGKQGLSCGGCESAQHFNCLKLPAERKELYLSGKENYLCVKCKTKHRRSLSFVANTSEQPKDLNATTSEHSKDLNASKASDTQTQDSTNIASLLLVIEKLQRSVEQLENRLGSALDEIRSLKQNQSSNTVVEKPLDRASDKKDFTINGLVFSEGEDLRAIVNQVVQSADKSFELDPSTTVKRLPAKKTTPCPTVLISVRGKNFEILKKIRRRAVVGKDIGLNFCDKIYINESHSPATYRLFKEARILKSKGYKFVWVQEDKVLLRKEGHRIEHLKSQAHLESILNTSQ